MEQHKITACTQVLQREMKYDGTTVLTYKIEYPQLKASSYQMALSLINQFYQTKAEQYQQYLEQELFPRAVEDYQYAVANGYPDMVYEAVTIYRMTYSSCCTVSIYSDQYEFTGGAHGNTVRSSQTWNLPKFRMIMLSELITCAPNYKDYLFTQIIAQINRDPSIYFEGYKQLVRETFHEESFYLTDRGIVIYYQQYDIAPYSSGIREFLIPYSTCVCEPKC